jgi:hypothetical protein
MSKVRWAVDNDAEVVQPHDHQFGGKDDGTLTVVRAVVVRRAMAINPPSVLYGVQEHGPPRTRRLLPIRRSKHLCCCWS